MRTFNAVRKPIYIAEVKGSENDFVWATDLFSAFIERYPQYKDCTFDKEYKGGGWTIKVYRQCVIDFV